MADTRIEEYVAEVGLVQELSKKWRADLKGLPLELSAKGDSSDGAHEALRAELWTVLSRLGEVGDLRVETLKSFNESQFFLLIKISEATARKLAAYMEENAPLAHSA